MKVEAALPEPSPRMIYHGIPLDEQLHDSPIISRRKRKKQFYFESKYKTVLCSHYMNNGKCSYDTKVARDFCILLLVPIRARDHRPAPGGLRLQARREDALPVLPQAGLLQPGRQVHAPARRSHAKEAKLGRNLRLMRPRDLL